MDPFLDARSSGIAHEHLAHHRLGHPPTLLGTEKRNAERRSEPFPPGLDPVLDDRRRPRIDTDRSSPIAFAVEHRNGTDVEVDILWLEGECFAHPESGAVHDGDEGAVPDTSGCVAALVEDGEHLIWREDLSREREPFVRRNRACASSRKCTCGSHEDTVCRAYDTSLGNTLYDKRIMRYNNLMDKDLYLLTTGALLRQRREAAQLTLAEVGRRSGVTIAHLSRIENGLADPRLSTLHRVLEAMGGTLSNLETPRVVTVSVDTVLERRVVGQERLDRVGLGHSNVRGRLDRRERAGVDVTVERSAMGSS